MNVQNNSGAILYRFSPIFQAPTRKRKTPVSELTGVFVNENARSLFLGSRSSSVFNGVSSFVDSALGSISSFVDGIIDGFIAFVARHGEYSEADPESTDRILQVLFDLQTVNLYAESIAHFNQLLLLELEPKQRREILYWIADSYRGMERFEQAALLYLQSAMLPAPDSMDPWAQTARFNAAESLQESGLIDDSRRIYEELLNITEDAARRSVLSHKIQQLWLTQNTQ